jgi:hypothetical protein
MRDRNLGFLTAASIRATRIRSTPTPKIMEINVPSYFVPMKLAAISLSTLCILALGCGPKFQEKDFYGDWVIDNASIPKDPNAQSMANAVLSLSFDRSFRLAFAPVTFKGAWSYSDRRLRITPETLVMQVQNRPLEFKISEIAEKFEPLMSGNPEGRKELEGIQAAGRPWDLKVSDDGKSLSTAEGLTWRKQAAE